MRLDETGCNPIRLVCKLGVAGFEPGTLHSTKVPLSGVFPYPEGYRAAAKSGAMESGWKEGRPDSFKDILVPHARVRGTRAREAWP
jgi:hypothetical protein